ncbi:hypothetical protein [Luteibacter sp.]|uniref:hypothetical protein n=1 Tax=Luteibacter sp. TaxID=1886636 RepID=UPI002806B779|nr:hypothetical protein [Luteibacter sp.]MDQ8048831.1 hypothetical protein [Luteibacter sp.]
MSQQPHALDSSDLEILRSYAEQGNRELYWNYLAQLPGNDGYGQLALGVVRNDNMPGATANAYAQAYAREHSHKTLSERDWDNFGVDLINQDLAMREARLKAHEPQSALNLPGRYVQLAHDKAFENIGVDPNAWTPRKLLEAARNHGANGPEESEKIWKTMLDNDLMGTRRGAATLGDMARATGMSAAERASYGADMAAAWTSAIGDRSHMDPNVIGRNDHFFGRDRNGDWSEFTSAQPTTNVSYTEMKDVTDPRLLRELEDTRSLRLEREAARKDFHPDDPGRLIGSPHPMADAHPRTSLPSAHSDPLYASLRMQLPMEISNDKAAQMALVARQSNIRDASELCDVEVQGRSIVCTGIRPGSVATLDLASPAPPMERSLAQGQQWDAALQQQARDASMQQASQQASVTRTGPVMGL